MTPTIHTDGSADVQAAGRDTEEELMMLNEKLALANLLRAWRNWFGNNWVTTGQFIDCLRHVGDRQLLHQIDIKSVDADELSRRLDEIRNKPRARTHKSLAMSASLRYRPPLYNYSKGRDGPRAEDAAEKHQSAHGISHVS